jgi:aldehyde dehydrogenase (NAD+)
MDAAAAAAAAAATAVEERERLRRSFASGRTRPAAWREAQLRGLLRMATEREDDICAALHADLAKPLTECYVHEVRL